MRFLVKCEGDGALKRLGWREVVRGRVDISGVIGDLVNRFGG